MTEQLFTDMERTLKTVVAALRDADIEFLIAGSLASWARGGPETRHDLDFFVRPQDARRALVALESAGLRSEEPPEDWLLKAWDGDVLVDLIFAPKDTEVDDALFERAERLNVLGLEAQVLSLEDLLVTKLCSLNEHQLRYEGLLAIARALREQIPWDRVRERTASSPYSRAFFVLCEDLGIGP